MPHHYHSPLDIEHACEEFVSLAQLVQSPQAIAEHGTLDPFPIEKSGTPLAMTSPFWQSELRPWYNVCQRSMPSETAMPGLIHQRGSCSRSSPDDSPSPRDGSSISMQHEQHQKRRAQNRAAQRAYRDRKMRHLVDLENGIKEIEGKIRRLQTENTELIRELCDIRAENREWKQGRIKSQAEHCRRDSNADAGHRPSSRTPPSRRCSKQLHTTAEDDSNGADSLYEPFAAMWNLIQLDLSVVNGNISAATLLERLKVMVETEMAVERRRLSLQSDASPECDQAAGEGE